MDPDRRRAIAGKGGRMAQKNGTAHQWTCLEAREAGRKGGRATHANRRRATDTRT
jgi:general stress protein YciG